MPWIDIVEIVLKVIADCLENRSAAWVERRIMGFDSLAVFALRRAFRKEGYRREKLRQAMAAARDEWEARKADGTLSEACHRMMGEAADMAA